MATYVTPKRGVEYIFYVGLASQADTKLLKGGATLAAGDVQVSKDGGAFANLTTLPAVTPAAGKGIKVTLSATEMTADNVTVVFSDAAGAEWCDLVVNIQTSARQIDDLATPTNITAGTITTATNVTTVNGLAANTITAASIAADAITDAKVAADVTIASVTGAVGSVTGAVGSVTAGVTLAASAVQAIWDALTTALTTVGSVGKLLVDNVNATISSRSTYAGGAVASVTAEVEITQTSADKIFGASGAALPELAQGIPSATPSPRAAIMALYMALRNKLDVTATTKSVTNDAGTVIFKKALSDDGTTYSEAEAVSGP